MAQETYETISIDDLESKLKREQPDNESESSGFALVNVLDHEQFESEHIPGSINIPADQIDAFEDRFGRDKEIVVYCASPECSASPKAAERLAERGFSHVLDYEAGMSGWKKAGHDVSTGA